MRFAQGHRAPTDLDMSLAPGEIRDATEAFVQLTETIRRDDADLEHALHQKEGLLGEMHHRVKNNLQRIASIISLQMREIGSGKARQLMRAVQDRVISLVISLATVHKDLYLTSDMTEVRADDLLPEIVQQVITPAAGAGVQIEVETPFADLALTPDQAGPLALLLAEVVTHARTKFLAKAVLPVFRSRLPATGATGPCWSWHMPLSGRRLAYRGPASRPGLGGN